CTATDGSYWALQNWRTPLPGLGLPPWLIRQKQWWLHLSHWSGAPAVLDVYQDWVYGRHIPEIFGQLTYRGVGIRGFGTTYKGYSPTICVRRPHRQSRSGLFGRRRKQRLRIGTWLEARSCARSWAAFRTASRSSRSRFAAVVPA